MSFDNINDRFSQITVIFFKDKDDVMHLEYLEIMSDVWLMNQETFLSLDIIKCRAASCFWSVCSLWSNPSGVSYFYICYPSKILSKNTKRVEGTWMPLEISLFFFSPKFNSMFTLFPVPFALTVSLALINHRYTWISVILK